MKRLVVALSVGAAASLCGLLVGLSQPGQWVAEVAGRPARGYDIFIQDRYFIIRPEILVVNLVIFMFVAYALMLLWVQRSRIRKGGAGA